MKITQYIQYSISVVTCTFFIIYKYCQITILKFNIYQDANVCYLFCTINSNTWSVFIASLRCLAKNTKTHITCEGYFCPIYSDANFMTQLQCTHSCCEKKNSNLVLLNSLVFSWSFRFTILYGVYYYVWTWGNWFGPSGETCQQKENKLAKWQHE